MAVSGLVVRALGGASASTIENLILRGLNASAVVADDDDEENQIIGAGFDGLIDGGGGAKR